MNANAFIGHLGALKDDVAAMPHHQRQASRASREVFSATIAPPRQLEPGLNG
jgi:hypothetical protein